MWKKLNDSAEGAATQDVCEGSLVAVGATCELLVCNKMKRSAPELLACPNDSLELFDFTGKYTYVQVFLCMYGAAGTK